MQRLSGSALGL